ncbi:MAG TPA: response regulator transcription factor [Syntrophales bacterium]|nr:response regulator transcription factor [Syntrophales bacterium]HOL59478.1 response regulator transcription factor [Syntrophales bacterium]HPO34660.1 response regulator transcription factor [Syntrophales bacterium]
MKRIRLLIADDHPIVREGLKKIIAADQEMEVVAEAGTGEEVLALLKGKKFDCIILDISMPGENGLVITREIKSHHPQLPVLIVSMYPEEQFAIRAFRAGASGYLTKTSAPTELLAAIRKVSKGGRYVSSSLAERLTYYVSGQGTALPHESLSDREYQIMLMIASGKTTAEIAEELSLSVKTISAYRTNILEKLHLKNAVELTRYAIEHGLIG